MRELETLSHVELCLRIHWSPSAVDFSDANQCEIARQLRDAGLVEMVDGHRYRTTKRGQVYVEAIRNLALPEQIWVMRYPADTGGVKP